MGAVACRLPLVCQEGRQTIVFIIERVKGGIWAKLEGMEESLLDMGQQAFVLR